MTQPKLYATIVLPNEQTIEVPVSVTLETPNAVTLEPGRIAISIDVKLLTVRDDTGRVYTVMVDDAPLVFVARSNAVTQIMARVE